MVDSQETAAGEGEASPGADLHLFVRYLLNTVNTSSRDHLMPYSYLFSDLLLTFSFIFPSFLSSLILGLESVTLPNSVLFKKY